MSDAIASVSMPQVRRRVIGSNVWLLSFGDLVTLLLGFFVAIIATAMHNPPKPVGGTQLATSDQEVSQGEPLDFHQVLVLAPENFEAGTGALVDNEANSLKTRLKFEGVTVSDILVQGCEETLDMNDEQARFIQIGRMLATAGQLIDAGVAERFVRIETPSTVCRQENGQETDPGSVVISITGKRNG